MPKNYHSTRRFGGRARHGRPASSARFSSKRVIKQMLHHSQFIKPARLVEQVAYEPLHRFEDFAIHPLLKQNVVAKGFVTPSPIQDQTIPLALQGKDIVGIANTGTGKTAAFALPLLTRVLNEKVKALIIAPTRELAQQIEDECGTLAKNSGLFGAILIGGTPMMPQIRDLRGQPDIVIGTPGRIKDHLERGNINLSEFSVIVLDEVDRMLDMGFIGDIRLLLSKLAENRQSLFFSATMDKKIESLIHTFLKDPITVSVKTGETSDNVEQNIVRYGGTGDKIEKLHDLLIQQEVAKVLIFDETKRSVERLGKELNSRGFMADSLHGGKTQAQRQRALDKFRNNKVTMLVATDVAARGIDVADITHVINYSVPNSYDDYVHRIGRAGRAGKPGNALTFVTA